MNANVAIPKVPAAPAPRPVRFMNDDDDLGASMAQTFTLLPLRIETRFLPANNQMCLWIRIYPDQIAIDGFDPRLTDGELADAVAYGQTLATCSNKDLATQQTAWQYLASRYGPGRAAYLADAVLPVGPLDYWLGAAAGTILQTIPGIQLGAATLTANLQKLGSRPSSYARAPLARCLPTRWLVYGLTQNAGTLAYEIKRPVNDDLNVGPSAEPLVPASTPGGASADREMLWLVDFQEAVRVGMAAILPLNESQAKSGFTSLYVVGIYDKDPAASQTTLEQLLAAHRFSDGWAVVPQGTPTKNASDAASGYSSQDPNFANSFAAERQVPLTHAAATGSSQGPDGLILAKALGLSPISVDHLQGTAGSNQYDAACMAQALWPSTIGYYLQFITQSGGAPSALTTEIHEAFINIVRGRGPIPAMRVGNVPYGVLPAGVIAQLLPADNPENDPLVPLLSKLWTSWQTGSQEYVGKTTDNVTDMGAVADLTPSSTTFSVIETIDPNFDTNPAQLATNGSYAAQLAVANQFAKSPAGRGVPPSQWLTLYGGPLLAFPLPGQGQPPQPIVAVVVDEQAPTDDNPSETMSYIQHLYAIYAESGNISLVNALIAEGNYPTYYDPFLYFNYSFLYLALRASLLISLGLACAIVLGVEPPDEVVLVDFAGEAGTPTKTLQRLITSKVPGTGKYACQVVFNYRNDSRFADFFNLGASLKRLASLSSAELQRLFTETLDCAIARIDAWITAIATSRLAKYPRENRGQLIGGYSWLQNVVPDETPASNADVATIEQIESAVAAASKTSPVSVSDIRSADVDNGGFVFAPSVTHAATAAILRNADLSNKDVGELGIPVNLSSARVRNAVSYLNGVRQGVSLGGLMGERAEEALADAGLSAYIQPLRDAFPLFANKLTQPSASQSASDVAAPNVLDGVALEQAMADGPFDWAQVVADSGAQLSATQAANDAASLATILAFLGDDFAAIADLSTSETIFQIVRGNPERAGSILDAIQRGAQLPEPQVVETPRTGLAITHRVLSVSGADPTNLPASPWGATTPRALAEPWLEAWLGSILPAPENIGFVCQYTGPNASIAMTLAELGLGALDLLALADTPDTSLGADLSDYLLYTALAKGAPAHPGSVTIEIFDLGASSTAIPLGRILPVLQAARELMSRSRTLAVEDLSAPRGAQASGTFNASELQGRVNALELSFSGALTNLQSALNSFNPATATPMLASALAQTMVALGAYGFPKATPPVVLSQSYLNLVSSQGGTAGADQAIYTSLAAQARTLIAQANTRAAAFALVPGTSATVKNLVAGAQAILGAGFVIVPLLPSSSASDFLKSTADWAGGVNGADNAALCGVMQQLTHVRPALASLDLFRAGVAILGQSRIVDFSVAQVAYDNTVPWLTLPVQPHDAGNWPTNWLGKTSLISWMPSPLSATAPFIYGLVFDDWTERIPSKSEKAAIAFHYAEPLAQSPQAILIAIATARTQPDGTDTQQTIWSYRTLLQILQDTFALTKARVTDPATVQATVPGLSQLLMAQNINNDTVSTFVV